MKNLLYPIVGIITSFTLSLHAQKAPWTAGRPDGHAPISVMGDHYHNKGDFMFSYRFMPMWMDGNLRAQNGIDLSTIHEDFMIAPLKMQMTMQMLGIMYAPSDHLTLMVMGNHITNTMDLQTRMGGSFTGSSGGFGDVSIAGLVRILNRNRQSLHANLGISIPAGDIDQRGNTPAMDNAPLAYPMQLGSGTWDPVFGITYFGQGNFLSWGLQLKSKWRTGKNSKDYTLGNALESVAWIAGKTSNWLSLSASLKHTILGSIRGTDSDLNPMMMPLFDAENSGRQELYLGIGANFYVPSGPLKNFRIGVEVSNPVYQHVIGIQMKNKAVATVGFQYAL